MSFSCINNYISYFNRILTKNCSGIFYFCKLRKMILKRLIKYLLGLFSVLLFLTATTGVRVYSHYCSTASVERVSLIEYLAECERHSKLPEAAHFNEQKSCCSKSKHCKTKPVKDDCCSNDSQFFKISDVFNTPSQEQRKLEPKEFNIEFVDFALVDEVFKIDIVSNLIIDSFHPPPPKSGKQLIVFLQHQKSDPNPIA